MRTIFFDIDTQLDFLSPAGALPVPGSEEIVPALAALTRFAADRHIPIVSTADAHTEDDPEFKVYKPHCVAGSIGQHKAAATLLSNPYIVISAPGAIMPGQDVSQIIVEKQNLDCFTNPNFRPLLEMLKPDCCLVYGVATELCVRYAAFGLLETGAQVELVTDSVKSLNPADARKTIERFQAQGGRFTTVSAVIA